jgi:hypothetical protein
MTTKQKIREACWNYKEETGCPYIWEDDFEAGYLTLLNSLEPINILGYTVYRLPEGVTKK